MITYAADNNVTSYSAGGSDPIEAEWGPGATLVFLRNPGAGFVEEDEWNEVTFDWERPDPNNRPNFRRIVYAEDALANDVQFLYGDPNDATRNTDMIETLDGESPVSVDGRENLLPSTGFGGFERYFVYDGTAGDRTHADSAFRSADAPASLIDDSEMQLFSNAYAWNWRAIWVVPLAAHIGVEYKYAGKYDTWTMVSLPLKQFRGVKDRAVTTFAGQTIVILGKFQ